MPCEEEILRAAAVSANPRTAGERVPEPARRACRFEGDNTSQSQAAEVAAALEVEVEGKEER